jgi:hypothetical protein
MTHGDLGGDSSGNSVNLLSLLVSNESRHSLDSLLLGDLLFVSWYPTNRNPRPKEYYSS